MYPFRYQSAHSLGGERYDRYGRHGPLGCALALVQEPDTESASRDKCVIINAKNDNELDGYHMILSYIIYVYVCIVKQCNVMICYLMLC